MKTADMFRLDGKVALVTGGGRGLGKFISGAERDGRISALALGKFPNLQTTAKELEGAYGIQALPCLANMEKPGGHRSAGEGGR